jgi:hypothetical protein
VIPHNLVDSTVMGRFLAMTVSRNDFHLAEDRSKNLAEGVIWRRRRFRFFVEEKVDDQIVRRPEALCINEISLDSQASAELSPRLAAEYPHLMDLEEVENAYWATTFAKGALRAVNSANTKETRLFLNMAGLYYHGSHESKAELLEKIRQVQTLSAWDDDLADGLEVLDPTLVEQPAGGFAVSRYLPAIPASRVVQSSESILAATNAGYFLNFPEEYDDGVSALHQPVGGHMIQGRLLSPCWIARPGLIGFDSGSVIEGLFGPSDLELLLPEHAPLPLRLGGFADSGNGTIYRFFDRAEVPVVAGGAVLFFTGDLLTAVQPSAPGLVPPRGGAAVLLHGEHAGAALRPEARPAIALRLRAFTEGSPRWMISSGPFLVSGGRAITPELMLTEPNAGEFRPLGPAPTRFPFDASITRAPRTAFGKTPQGGLKLVVVDGRRSGEHSCGMTLEGMAHLMAWVGCDSAINLDGGGSSVMAVEGVDASDRLHENLAHSIVNIPSDGNGVERAVPILMVVEGRLTK